MESLTLPFLSSKVLGRAFEDNNTNRAKIAFSGETLRIRDWLLERVVSANEGQGLGSSEKKRSLSASESMDPRITSCWSFVGSSSRTELAPSKKITKEQGLPDPSMKIAANILFTNDRLKKLRERFPSRESQPAPKKSEESKALSVFEEMIQVGAINLRQIQDSYESGDFEKVIDLAHSWSKRHINRTKLNMEIRCFLIMSYLMQDKLELAKINLTTLEGLALRSPQTDRKVALLEARLLLAEGKKKEAQALVIKALEGVPKAIVYETSMTEVEIYSSLLDCLYQARSNYSPEENLSFFYKFLRANFHFEVEVVLHRILVQIHLELGKPFRASSLAKNAYKRSDRVWSKAQLAHLGALALFDTAHSEEAVSWLEEGLALIDKQLSQKRKWGGTTLSKDPRTLAQWSDLKISLLLLSAKAYLKQSDLVRANRCVSRGLDLCEGTAKPSSLKEEELYLCQAYIKDAEHNFKGVKQSCESALGVKTGHFSNTWKVYRLLLPALYEIKAYGPLSRHSTAALELHDSSAKDRNLARRYQVVAQYNLRHYETVVRLCKEAIEEGCSAKQKKYYTGWKNQAQKAIEERRAISRGEGELVDFSKVLLDRYSPTPSTPRGEIAKI